MMPADNHHGCCRPNIPPRLRRDPFPAEGVEFCFPHPQERGLRGMAFALHAERSVTGCFTPRKKPAGGGFFGTTCCSDGSADGLDVRGEAALVAGGLVLVDQA